MTFFDKFCNGDVQRDDIFSYIEQWHKNQEDKKLIEYLGTTLDQYHIFLMEPDKVESLRKGRQ